MGKKGQKPPPPAKKAPKKNGKEPAAAAAAANQTLCVCPEGCIIEDGGAEDGVTMFCSNEDKCTSSRFVHTTCLARLEERLVKRLLNASGRSRSWTEQQIRSNIWNRKGYDLVMSQCRCPCTGFLRRHDDYSNCANEGDDDEEKKEPKKKKKTKAPVGPKYLSQAPGHTVVTGKPTPKVDVSVPSRPRTYTLGEHWGAPDDDEDDASIGVAEPTGWRRSSAAVERPVGMAPPPMPPAPLPRPTPPPTIAGGNWAQAVGGAHNKLVTIDSRPQLIGAIHQLLIQKRGVLSTSDRQLDVVLQQLSVDMQADVAKCEGLVPWLFSNAPPHVFDVTNDRISIVQTPPPPPPVAELSPPLSDRRRHWSTNTSVSSASQQGVRGGSVGEAPTPPPPPPPAVFRAPPVVQQAAVFEAPQPPVAQRAAADEPPHYDLSAHVANLSLGAFADSPYREHELYFEQLIERLL